MKETLQVDERTLTALYDTMGAAESARDELVRVGVPHDRVSIRAADAAGATTTGGNEDRGFWGSLSDLFMPDEDRHTYAEGMRRGACLLTANVPAGLEDEAIAVLERSEPVDLDERSASWRQSGWTGQTEGYAAAGTAGAGVAPVLAEDQGAYRGDTTGSAHATTGTAAATGTTGALGVTGASAATTRGTAEGQDRLQVVEEQLRVGKREVGRGSVRVRSYVTERPVEEQVELRQERVHVERRPVDRELAPGEATAVFQERTIEAVERGEEAVVSKSARVVEEIAVGKEVERETETVRDTVRRQDVEVEDERGATGRGLGTTGGTGGGVTGTTTETDVTGTGTATGTDRTPLDPTTR